MRGLVGGCKAHAFFFFFSKQVFALEGERRGERSAEGQLKRREAEMSFSDVFALEIKLHQQAGADRNWIKTFRAASPDYEYHIYYARTTLDHPPAPLKNTYNDASVQWYHTLFNRGDLQSDSGAPWRDRERQAWAGGKAGNKVKRVS